MSKTNDTSRPATLEDHHPLADGELDAVTGGWLPTGIPGAAAYYPVEDWVLSAYSAAARQLVGDGHR